MTDTLDFFRAIERHGDAIALIDGDRRIGFAELAALADRRAREIGDARCLVFLECRNDAASIAAYLGCLRGGHAVHLFADMDERRLADLIALYRPAIVLRHADGQLVQQRPEAPPLAPLHPELRVLLATSGSTGSAKLVKLSERNLAANAWSIASYLELTSDDRAMTSLKFNYSYGMSVVNSHLAVGGALVLTDATVVAPEFWRRCESAGATSFAGVPYSFEMLASQDAWAATPGLRYVTQAGGRLSPELVRRTAQLGELHGWRFFVMYGQTEAAPRMAWLPPELAAAHPDCIGRAVPGGAFALLADDGSEIADPAASGELAYVGPNVMMGYAKGPAELAIDANPARLLTGDIAVRTSEGLYRIVGRTARMIKPFGIRLNLDELQDQVRETIPGAICTGTDERIVIAVAAHAAADFESAGGGIARRYRLPPFMVRVVAFEQIPVLPSGKPDYQAILASGAVEAGARTVRSAPLAEQLSQTIRMAVAPGLYRRAWLEAKTILGLAKADWPGVGALFAATTGVRDVRGGDSFLSLAGDSLTYVQASLALEDHLGVLPGNWDELTVAELDALRSHEPVI